MRPRGAHTLSAVVMCAHTHPKRKGGTRRDRTDSRIALCTRCCIRTRFVAYGAHSRIPAGRVRGCGSRRAGGGGDRAPPGCPQPWDRRREGHSRDGVGRGPPCDPPRTRDWRLPKHPHQYARPGRVCPRTQAHRVRLCRGITPPDGLRTSSRHWAADVRQVAGFASGHPRALAGRATVSKDTAPAGQKCCARQRRAMRFCQAGSAPPTPAPPSPRPAPGRSRRRGEGHPAGRSDPSGHPPAGSAWTNC